MSLTFPPMKNQATIPITTGKSNISESTRLSIIFNTEKAFSYFISVRKMTRQGY